MYPTRKLDQKVPPFLSNVKLGTKQEVALWVIPKSPIPKSTTSLFFSTGKKKVNPDINFIDSLLCFFYFNKLNFYLSSRGLLPPERWESTASHPIIEHKFTHYPILHQKS